MLVREFRTVFGSRPQTLQDIVYIGETVPGPSLPLVKAGKQLSPRHPGTHTPIASWMRGSAGP